MLKRNVVYHSAISAPLSSNFMNFSNMNEKGSCNKKRVNAWNSLFYWNVKRQNSIIWIVWKKSQIKYCVNISSVLEGNEKVEVKTAFDSYWLKFYNQQIVGISSFQCTKKYKTHIICEHIENIPTKSRLIFKEWKKTSNWISPVQNILWHFACHSISWKANSKGRNQYFLNASLSLLGDFDVKNAIEQ